MRPVKTIKNPVLDLILASIAKAKNIKKFAIKSSSIFTSIPHYKHVYHAKYENSQ